ncbi:unnamed protein product [Dracunculus medinensis]|uniref:CAP-Gly domain-containing protein n=1 Tax=Dracunculus medinensis TaxID=318479 RepID=A0A0N4U4B6_DRAME|nr:unnamed protein product [Dracunculus medinensis]
MCRLQAKKLQSFNKELQIVKCRYYDAMCEEKLQLVVGMSKEQMHLELRDKNNEFIAMLNDDCAILENMGICDGMVIHAVSTFGESNLLNDSSMVEKYELPDADYEKRSDSVRAWMRQKGFNKSHSSKEIDNAESVKHFKIGDRCKVILLSQQKKLGEISYIGLTDFKPGYWIGVTYDEPVGKHDGCVAGKRYFSCADKHGVFVRPRDIQVISSESEEESGDEAMEI